MSLPAEQLHKQSLDILAKFATSNKCENGKDIEVNTCDSNKIKINNDSCCIKRCSLCVQVNCDRNCEKENMVKLNPQKQIGLETPQKSIISSEPITPTANLKMLVSAASDLQPALPKMDKKIEIYDVDSEYGDDLAIQKVKLKKGELMGRKEKSLGLLCKKFMSIYPEFSPLGTTIMLDDVVKSLSIGRRRVYDIVNVLESMEMMVRQAKNKYIWFGKSRLPATLAKLKALALRVYGPNFCHILKRFCRIIGKPTSSECPKKTCFILPKDYSIKPGFLSAYEYLNKTAPSTRNTVDDTTESGQPKVDDLTSSIMDSIISYDIAKRDCNRSLGILCQKFIMLFMVAEDSVVSLDRAAKLLITEPEEGPGKYKTKVRRLYDIANILTSINFLEKCVSYEDATKKAAYKWIGLDLKAINCEEGASKAFLSQEFSLTRHSLLTQAPRDRYKMANDRDKIQQRKFRFRSSSAHQLNVSNPKHKANSAQPLAAAKHVRSFSLRTLSDTMVNNERNIELQNGDGFDIENLVEVVDNDTSSGDSTKGTQLDSPNQRLFKEKLRCLQREFPDKLPGNDLLSACKDYSTKAKVSHPSRRRLSSDFDSQVSEPPSKKPKVEKSENSNPSIVFPDNPVVTAIPYDRSPSRTLVSLLNNNNIYTNGMLIENDVVINSENIPPNAENNGNWQQPTYFTIPATLKPVGKPGSPAHNITTMLVSPLSNPLSIPKSGLYQIIPVQCHSVVERNESSVSPGQATLMAKGQKSSSEGYKMPEKSVIPLLMRPPIVTVTSPSVAISPTPSSLKNFTDSPVNYQQLNGNYQEFVTPPHVLYRNFSKPPANPIIFPKMTPETPSSSGPISQSVLTNVTRKLMALQKEDTI